MSLATRAPLAGGPTTGDLRVFYAVVGDEIRVAAIGRKIRNQLVIDGKRMTL